MRVTAYFDGGARGTPGPAACASIIKRDGRLYQAVHDLGIATNNEAEWTGLLLVLDQADGVASAGDELVIYGDSKLVVQQALGNWDVKAMHLRWFRDEAFERARRLRSKGIEVTITHVPRDMNNDADEAVRDHLDAVTGRKRR